MIHRHLDYDQSTPLVERGRAAIDDALESGDLGDWAALARAIDADPHGRLASTVLETVEAHPMYGTSALWRLWITRKRDRGTEKEAGSSIAELRKRRGLRQSDIAAAMDTTQPDVSKLEAREDVRLSTLSAYVSATGGRLECRAVYPDEVVQIAVRPSR